MPQGSEEGIGSYLGRSPDVVNIKEKSAPARLRHSGGEAIVVDRNEPMERSEDSRSNEGPNVKLFEIRSGGSNLEFASLTLN